MVRNTAYRFVWAGLFLIGGPWSSLRRLCENFRICFRSSSRLGQSETITRVNTEAKRRLQSIHHLLNASPFLISEFSTVKRQLKNIDEDRVVDNNEGLPQALLGSCNDRARQIYIKMPIKDPSINPPTTSLFWKVRMLRGGEVRSRDLISPMLDKKRFRSPLPHLTRSDGLNSFNECQHPDETQRMQLSRVLGLAPRQIKFWFQNRRKLNKAQHERDDNYALKKENDRICCERE
ncbi:hypothetical protein DY000_02040234 [Brassica cretica]|uniref:Homeobox domain-containing protein n=1 Tax=Brassica cretica TaxID=69181 RepID=A0ABQ7BJ48_BRACR|nr:hypothetical protein DY000_02040234 [Brassica cretica]